MNQKYEYAINVYFDVLLLPVINKSFKGKIPF